MVQSTALPYLVDDVALAEHAPGEMVDSPEQRRLLPTGRRLSPLRSGGIDGGTE